MRHLNAMLLALVLLFSVGQASAEPIAPYSDPLPIGDYVDDVHGLLERGFSHGPWGLTSQTIENTYTGFLSYKGFDITIGIDARDQAISLNLESVYETGCTDSCRDLGEERVVGWLVSLRRAIAYELTLSVRQHLSDQM